MSCQRSVPWLTVPPVCPLLQRSYDGRVGSRAEPRVGAGWWRLHRQRVLATLNADGGFFIDYTARRPRPNGPVQGRLVPLGDLEAIEPERLLAYDVVVDLVSRGRGRLALSRDILARVGGHFRLIDGLANRDWAGHYVYLSSGGMIYGPAPPDRCPESAPVSPVGDYALEKAMVELHLRSVCKQSAMRASILRVANAYGETQPGHLGFGVIPALVAALREGTPFPIYGTGGDRRDYTHVDDVAAAIVAAIFARGVGTLNISSGVGTSVWQLMTLCTELSGRPLTSTRVEAAATEPRSVVLCNALAAERIGWRPCIDLPSGLARVLAAHGLLRIPLKERSA